MDSEHQSSGSAPRTNDQHLNGHLNGIQDGQGKLSLRVVIIGAGIGGLFAAIVLRRQGHEVVVRCKIILKKLVWC